MLGMLQLCGPACGVPAVACGQGPRSRAQSWGVCCVRPSYGESQSQWFSKLSLSLSAGAGGDQAAAGEPGGARARGGGVAPGLPRDAPAGEHIF